MHTGTGLASAWGAGLEDRKLRQLALALLASLAFHALILLSLAYLKDGQRVRAAPPPLTARIAQPKPPPELQIVEPLPQRLPANPRAARPLSPSLPAVAPALVLAPTPQLKVEPAPQAAEPALVAPAAPVAKADPQSAARPSNAPDEGLLAKFRLELIDIARRYEHYPRIARENNWTGTAQLRMVIGADGAIASLVVRKSSGHAVLDQESLAKMRTAYANATVPPALLGKVLTLDVQMTFNLND